MSAVRILGLPAVPPWQIFFVEDVTTPLGSIIPLSDHGLLIRARQKTKGNDDVTVKFRPGRRSQLSNAWLATTKTPDGDLKAELKIEQDWAGARRTLAISLTSDRPDGLVAAAIAARNVSALLTQDQKKLIDQCAGVGVNLDVLTVLPAVSAPGPAGSALSVRAERWFVGALDFIELSIAVGVEAAEEAQTALEDFLLSKGLQPAVDEAKTSQVLRLLVAQAAASSQA